MTHISEEVVSVNLAAKGDQLRTQRSCQPAVEIPGKNPAPCL